VLTEKRIVILFGLLNEELKKENEIGEVGIVGGAVMCLVYKARPSTQDIDALFEPTKKIRSIVKKIGKRENLPEDWLNDGVKTFITDNFKRQTVIELSNLRVWAPEPRYMLAMKCISARWDSHDKDDVKLLLKFLKMKDSEKVLDLIESYYPKNRIPVKTKFFLEELLEKK
jgi:hypothetical protein